MASRSDEEQGSQYERLVVVMAELRERGRRIIAEAQDVRTVSLDLRAVVDAREERRLEGPPLASRS
jgi:Flp pilus assembly protein CpaB